MLQACDAGHNLFDVVRGPQASEKKRPRAACRCRSSRGAIQGFQPGSAGVPAGILRPNMSPLSKTCAALNSPTSCQGMVQNRALTKA